MARLIPLLVTKLDAGADVDSDVDAVGSAAV